MKKTITVDCCGNCRFAEYDPEIGFNTNCRLITDHETRIEIDELPDNSRHEKCPLNDHEYTFKASKALNASDFLKSKGYNDGLYVSIDRISKLFDEYARLKSKDSNNTEKHDTH